MTSARITILRSNVVPLFLYCIMTLVSVVISLWLLSCMYQVSKKWLLTWSSVVGHAIIFIMAFTIAPVGVA